MVKKWIKFGLLWGALLGFTGCGPEAPPAGTPAIQINGVSISREDFNARFKGTVSADPDLDADRAAQRAFVDYLIQQELMIQTAVDLGLSREPAFIETIERHWESTLIRNLLARKTRELRRGVVVTREAALALYQAHPDRYPEGFEAARPRIDSRLESQGVRRAMEAWVKELRARARIEVDPSLL